MTSRAEKAAQYVPGVDDIGLDLFWWAMTPEHVADLEDLRAAWEAEAEAENRSVTGELRVETQAAL